MAAAKKIAAANLSLLSFSRAGREPRSYFRESSNVSPLVLIFATPNHPDPAPSHKQRCLRGLRRENTTRRHPDHLPSEPGGRRHGTSWGATRTTHTDQSPDQAPDTALRSRNPRTFAQPRRPHRECRFSDFPGIHRANQPKTREHAGRGLPHARDPSSSAVPIPAANGTHQAD